MKRINVYGMADGDRTLAGWFDLDAAEVIDEATRWNGNDHVSVHTSDQFAHERLIRTSGGRWVQHRWSQWQNVEDVYEYVNEDRAREWLLINEDDTRVEKYFGELEQERGPGRPEVGRAINIRLGDDLLAQMDAEAATRGKTRADTVRDLLAGLALTRERMSDPAALARLLSDAAERYGHAGYHGDWNRLVRLSSALLEELDVSGSIRSGSRGSSVDVVLPDGSCVLGGTVVSDDGQTILVEARASLGDVLYTRRTPDPDGQFIR